MTLDDIKGRTYTNQADFWRDVELALIQARRIGAQNERRYILERLENLDVYDDYGDLEELRNELRST